MWFALRLFVGSAIGIAFLLARDFHGYSFGYSIASAVCAVALMESTAWLYSRHHTAGIVIAVIIAGGAVGGATAYNLRLHPSPIEYLEVDVVMAEPARWLDDTIKLHGYIEENSVKLRVENQRSQHAFTIHVKDKRVAAHLSGPVPDTFKDRAEVVATGRLVRANGAYLFEATEVSAKCPSTYQTASGPQPASTFR